MCLSVSVCIYLSFLSHLNYPYPSFFPFLFSHFPSHFISGSFFFFFYIFFVSALFLSSRCWSSEVNHPCPGFLKNVPASRNYEGGFGSGTYSRGFIVLIVPVLVYFVQSGTVLYCPVLYYTILYCTVLHCTILLILYLCFYPPVLILKDRFALYSYTACVIMMYALASHMKI